jgi:hypothetical protein
MGSMIDVSEFMSQNGQVFLLLHIFQIGSWFRPAYYSINTWVSFPWGKFAQGMRMTTHLPRQENAYLHMGAPHTSSWCGGSLVKHVDNFNSFFDVVTKYG